MRFTFRIIGSRLFQQPANKAIRLDGADCLVPYTTIGIQQPTQLADELLPERTSNEEMPIGRAGAAGTSCEARKTPAVPEVFFLDLPFYRTYRDLTSSEPSEPRFFRF
jgi:hypothetical protein